MGERFGNFLPDALRRRFRIGRVANGTSHDKIISAGLNRFSGCHGPLLVIIADDAIRRTDTRHYCY